MSDTVFFKIIFSLWIDSSEYELEALLNYEECMKNRGEYGDMPEKIYIYFLNKLISLTDFRLLCLKIFLWL